MGSAQSIEAALISGSDLPKDNHFSAHMTAKQPPSPLHTRSLSQTRHIQRPLLGLITISVLCKYGFAAKRMCHGGRHML